MLTHIRRELTQRIRPRVNDRPHSRTIIHAPHPSLDPRPITKLRIVLSFPIQRKHGTPDISDNVVHEEIGLRHRIIAHCIMIHADTFTAVHCTTKLIIRGLINAIDQTDIIKTANTPSRTGHNKISVKRIRINITLPIAHVKTTHIRACRRHKNQRQHAYTRQYATPYSLHQHQHPPYHS